jgi:hypothetical protein
MQMKFYVTTLFALIAIGSNAQADSAEITNQVEMISCLKKHVQQRAAPESISRWEDSPRFEYGGNFFHGNWTTASLYNVSFFLVTKPDSEVYCDYPFEGGMPQTKEGFCKPTIKNGDVAFVYNGYNDGTTELRNFAAVVDSKLYCLEVGVTVEVVRPTWRRLPSRDYKGP